MTPIMAALRSHPLLGQRLFASFVARRRRREADARLLVELGVVVCAATSSPRSPGASPAASSVGCGSSTPNQGRPGFCNRLFGTKPQTSTTSTKPRRIGHQSSDRLQTERSICWPPARARGAIASANSDFATPMSTGSAQGFPLHHIRKPHGTKGRRERLYVERLADDRAG